MDKGSDKDEVLTIITPVMSSDRLVTTMSSEKRYQLVNDDFYKMVQSIESKSIDLILTDPPYNLSKYSTGNMKFSWRTDINNDLAEWDLAEFKPENVLEEFQRILHPKGNLFVFCSYNLLGDWHRTFDPIFDTFQYMVWHKTNPAPKIRKAGFLNSCELIICCWNKGHTWHFGKQSEMHNFIETHICQGNERTKDPKHPTQKPVGVLKHIIRIASNEGDLVFDPFMGVGSTGVAALELNRRFVGVEIDKRYFDAAEKRIVNVPVPLAEFVEAETDGIHREGSDSTSIAGDEGTS